MKPSKETIRENLSEQYTVNYELSLKLLAWAAFIEKQPECEGYPELEGLGLSLREYGEALDHAAQKIDQAGLELAKLFKQSSSQKRKHTSSVRNRTL